MREEIKGYVERITYQNEENGYTVAKIKMPKMLDLLTVVGSLPSIQVGETLWLLGTFKMHPVHGKQFEVLEYRVDTPSDVEGIEKYLGSGLIKGIGPVYAKKIVKAFGKETLTVLEKTPARLSEVGGVGPKRVKQIIDCFTAQQSIREVMVFLQNFGVTPSFAQKIYKLYGNDAIEIVKDNPYRLADDIFGIGFKTADRIAQNLGIKKNSSVRIKAGISFVLHELAGDGHICYPIPLFLPIAKEKLETEEELIEKEIPLLEGDKKIVTRDMMHEGVKTPFIFLSQHFFSEVGIAREIKRLKMHPCSHRPVNAEKALAWFEERESIKLAPHQREAVRAAIEDSLLIITGGPGTGKSTITKAILEIISRITPKILLAAPTGRAAKRMNEITKYPAKTIHSLLEFQPRLGGFKRNKENPLACDLLIVDEASMIDSSLMFHLLKAVPNGAKVIFVGDVNQLPSVGPGNVLGDLITSKKVKVSMLQEIFRQARGSRIITNAHLILKGSFPDIRNIANSDFYFVEAEDNETLLHEILTLATKRLPLRYNLNPLEEIQVLAPMKKGLVGTENINAALQKELNPKGEGINRFGKTFKEGDKVMQLRNNYDKGVFNGDIGLIQRIDREGEKVVILFDEKEVFYDLTDLDEICLAYACSVHKYQGSQCKACVISVSTSNYMMLQRNLLYTAVTRASKLCVLVGSKKAIRIACMTSKSEERFTALPYALEHLL